MIYLVSTITFDDKGANIYQSSLDDDMVHLYSSLFTSAYPIQETRPSFLERSSVIRDLSDTG
jgi:hypothetical protein